MTLPPNDSMLWKLLFLMVFNISYVALSFANFDNPPELAKDGPMLAELNFILLAGMGVMSRKQGEKK